ncbi:hypothetical protein V7x_42650 [Crateriforma conspicua]|uniref:Uncharacterized protein n=1 Tax=Crateriforma conspicua TaxID=2527996 RepID=A0A5C6FK98_9PLAN|nr:hypothetical protein [Crateriforma conspicua]TWU62530.1 hypothetical protein V7x_42650 [Crateriforma conspicua]
MSNTPLSSSKQELDMPLSSSGKPRSGEGKPLAKKKRSKGTLKNGSPKKAVRSVITRQEIEVGIRRPNFKQLLEHYEEILGVHPACESVRELSDYEWKRLCTSIFSGAAIDPATITESGLLVDGRHRCLAAIALGRQDDVTFTTVAEADAYAVVARRLIGRKASLIDLCRAALKYEEQQARSEKMSVAKIADMFGMSKRSFDRYRKIASNARLVAAVHEGKIDLTKAAAVVSELDGDDEKVDALINALAAKKAGKESRDKGAAVSEALSDLQSQGKATSTPVKGKETSDDGLESESTPNSSKVVSGERRPSTKAASPVVATSSNVGPTLAATSTKSSPGKSDVAVDRRPQIVFDGGPVVVRYRDVFVVVMQFEGAWEASVHGGTSDQVYSANNRDDAIAQANSMLKRLVDEPDSDPDDQ